MECNMARSVWSLKENDIMLPLMSDETHDPRLWLFNLSRTLTQSDFIEVLVTLWSIWWARRKLIHEGEQQAPLSMHLFIERYMNELKILDRDTVPKSHVVTTVKARWLAPPEGFIKINADAAVSRDQERGAVACVSRDSRGTFCGASAIVFDGMINPEVLEALACSEALALATDTHVSSLLVASDCQNVIKEINDGGKQGQHGMIIRDIMAKKQDFFQATFSHERREANGEAHRLARSATTLDTGRHVWYLTPPSHLGIFVNTMNNQ
jgi:ribonuclease HI